VNRKALSMGTVAFVLLALAAAFLSRIEMRQKIGTPGVRVAQKPIHDEKGEVAGLESVDLPQELPGFTSEEEVVTRIELNWLPKDTVYGRRIYKATNGFQNVASVVLMGRDRTSIHKPQYCLAGQGWTIEKSEVISIPMAKPIKYDLKAMKLTLSRPYTQNGMTVKLRGFYVYWFVADDQLTPLHGERMWWMARDLIFKGVLQRWAYVAYLGACAPQNEETYFERMKDFIAESLPLFQIPPGKTTESTRMAVVE
jgi:hypothetical protein